MSDHKITRRNFVGVAGVAAAAAVGAGIAGCSSGSASASSASASASSASASAAASSAAAAAAKPVILVTSFGTSFADSRHITIGAIEDDIREAYPDYDVRRAFTAQIIIDHVEKDTGRHINNFKEAMDQIVADGVKEVVVQPTHLMGGFEYTDIKDELAEYEGKLKTALGEPLLSSEADQKAVAQAIKKAMEKYEGEGTAICLMGHGTEADSNSIYTTMQKVFTDLGYNNYFVATVEATPTFDDVINAAKAAGFTKAVLRPMMVVAGDHANNDMADEEDPESFASKMKAAGFEVQSVIEGLGQVNEVQEIYVDHVKAAIAKLS